ncbi:MAG TPA: ATP synthase F1 subunit gamma [Candidatus Eisenbacteria bacterium]|nr:ATP synthase F1 subunit gamma [Candidatus Eisenbacteria bacterium]
MPSLKALRKRITTVRSTQQITKAMKMVAAAKLRRAQEAAERARPYSAKVAEMFGAVVADLEGSEHPLLARRDEQRIEVVVVTSDRGLCGGYNSNLLRRVEAFAREHTDKRLVVTAVGRKALEFFRRRNFTLVGQQTDVLARPAIDSARAVAEGVTKRFASGETDAVYLLYNAFRSAMSQVPTVTPLLPVTRPERAQGEQPVEYIFEPARPELLALLLPRYIDTLLMQALLESIASEHGARMTAMENATNNASDMIGRLTLSMNRARQAAITTELMEIVSGAEALKG